MIVTWEVMRIVIVVQLAQYTLESVSAHTDGNVEQNTGSVNQ